MKIELPYAKEKININIPDENILDIITGESRKVSLDQYKIIADVLDNPVSSKKLSELARGRKNAVILVSDITRPCPSYKFLPKLIEELNKGGIENNSIKIILGLGIHREHTEEEKRKLVGDYIFKNMKILDSDVSRARIIGHTSAGTPVEIFEEALNTDLLIATGNIEYHYFAGYSGGAKAVMPGICTRSSIQANHSMVLNERAVAGNYIDNPVRADIEEAGRMTGIDFIFNVILDDKKNIISAVAGKNNEAYIEGIRKYDDIYKREVENVAEIVIVSQGGFPKDLNFYQSQKALENIKEIVAKNGTIILIAECSEGFGEDVFEEWMADIQDYQYISKKLKREFVLGAHKAVAVSRLITKADILFYSEFSKDKTEKMGFKKVQDIQEYIDNRVSKDNDIKITIVPTGRFVRLKK